MAFRTIGVGTRVGGRRKSLSDLLLKDVCLHLIIYQIKRKAEEDIGVITIKSTVQSRAYSPQHFYKNRILDQYVSQQVNTITLRQLVVFGRNLTEERLLRSGNYVRTELPIRLAHRIRDFQNLPFIVGTNPHIAMVYDLYWSAFEKLRKFPTITNLDENDEFCDTVKGLLKDHLVVIPQLAMGISECSQHLHPDHLDRFMNTMFRSRISRRVLAEQQIALTENWNDPGYVYGQDGHDGYIGIVSTQCNSGEIVERCANMTRNLCRTIYKVEPPQIIVDGHANTTFAYIPDHIEYILYELLKNSIRGVMMKFSPSLKDVSESPEFLQKFHKFQRLKSLENSMDSSSTYPPISVTISSGSTDLYFRISDQGGGISDEISPHIWSFASTSTLNNKFENFAQVPQMAAKVHEYEQLIIPPTLHLGIGLPMSKVYTEYWGGGLTLFTMDGYGTDAYVKISRLGNREENLE
ncbi:12928_t:CDS:2 [Funneliformis geosporum]|uniref:Protein-serine/threonine kinase n=1 Tax=Funneliformis geosporum TaxID=1117311 RepID=A0A9W4WSC6_9GLOM|nr:12928_t:CDS:2 [Funneliformis geosporum]CAI2168517.1 4467_t:CDS:2 [Funneliformis geosporum]